MKSLVILVASSDFSTDPRVYKQAISARDAGFDVTVYCYNNFNNYSDTIEEGCRIIRVPYMDIIRRIPVIPVFMLEIIEKITTVCVKKTISKYSHHKFESTSPTTSHKILDACINTCTTYIWASILYLFAQIHFYLCIIEKRADVYHATDLVTLLTGVLMKYTHGGKLLYDSHEMWVESMEEYTPRVKKILYVYEGILIRCADAVTTVNSQIAKELSKKYNISLPTVVMNTPLLQNAPVQNNHKNIRVIYQGRYTRNRGIENVVCSVPSIPGVELYMRGIDAYAVGGVNPYIEELKQMNSKVIFLPSVSMRDLVQSLNEFDIGIVPYIGTNFNNTNASPNKTFEYMMAGLAVVASDLPVLREIIDTCNCGCTYIPDNPEDLARVITEMIPHLEKYKRNAREWSEKEYNWDIQGEKIINIYNKLLTCS